ncbi:hypothetical protein WKK05_19675 [Nostoc sp. UHCC 0302]
MSQNICNCSTRATNLGENTSQAATAATGDVAANVKQLAHRVNL